ncbi:hypothetical protein GGTG_07421 [Gaeumannomyces tritici R3-111a-1]|uniref:Uncharacterized protein n=1 Tax=Gaeumannomyces tritici (strain R3-111a-1) TaxID=644352 RepID=J3P1M3_GAET3|nr:hypothetical protein GGTG_07421 [Gaeumannomyces tritici R3-111a-1]EJT73565.1 hypothetical protein GGTG_07421 [Gaeumannomyces tritici R3-111a-1]
MIFDGNQIPETFTWSQTPEALACNQTPAIPDSNDAAEFFGEEPQNSAWIREEFPFDEDQSMQRGGLDEAQEGEHSIAR